MSKYEMVRLGDVYTITSSKRVFQSEWKSKGVPFYRAREIAKLAINGYVDNELFISEEMYDKYNAKYGMPQPNDLMVTGVGTLGVCYVVKEKDKFYFKDGNIIWLKPKGKICSQYVKWAFKSHSIKEQIHRNSSGTTVGTYTITNANKTYIPLPPLNEQRRIAESLDLASSLIEKRKKQIELLDLLAKSLFIEMFGDPVENPMGWEVVQYSSILIEKAQNGFFAKNNEYTSNGNAKVIWISDFIDRLSCDLSKLKKVQATKKDIQKYQVSYGDLLFCRSSLVKAGIGKSSHVPKNIKENTIFECHIIKTKVNLEKVNPIFLQVQTTTDFFREQIFTNSKTSTMTTISQEGITKNMIILPPIGLQNYFADIMSFVETQKSILQSGLEKLEMNYNALMQKYFEDV